MNHDTIINFLDEAMHSQEIMEIVMPRWMIEVYKKNTVKPAGRTENFYTYIPITMGKEFKIIFK